MCIRDRLIKEAFETAEHTDGSEQDLVCALRKSDAFIADLSLVAEISGEIAGHILLSLIHIYTQPEMNQTIAVVPDGSQENRDRITSAFLESDQVQAVSFTDDIKASFQNTIKSIDFIVIVLIVSSGLLAFVRCV